MKTTFEIEWPHTDLSMPDYRQAVNNLRTMGFAVRELPAAPVNPMSGPIPVKSLALLEGLEDQKLGNTEAK